MGRACQWCCLPGRSDDTGGTVSIDGRDSRPSVLAGGERPAYVPRAGDCRRAGRGREPESELHMPDRSVRTLRHLIWYQYAKIIARRAMGPAAKKEHYGFVQKL